MLPKLRESNTYITGRGLKYAEEYLFLLLYIFIPCKRLLKYYARFFELSRNAEHFFYELLSG
jgi:hypothetical protein